MTTLDRDLTDKLLEIFKDAAEADTISIHDMEALVELLNDYVTRGYLQ